MRMTVKLRRERLYIFFALFYFFCMDYVYLCIPSLNILLNSKLVGVFLIALIGYKILRRGLRIPRNVVIVYLILAAAVLFSLLSASNTPFIFDHILTLNNFKYIFVFPLFLFSMEDIEDFNDDLYISAYFILIIYFMAYILVLSYKEDFYINYGMWFGFQATFFWIIIIQHAFSRKNVIDLAVSAITAIFIISCASRSVIAAMAVAVFFLVFFYFGTNAKRKTIFLMLFCGCVFLIFSYMDNIIKWLIKILSNFKNMGRTLYWLQTNLFDMDGRDFIWRTAIEEILLEPFKMRGICGDMVVLKERLGVVYYAHNIIIEILLDFGIVIGGIFLMAFFWCMYQSIFGKMEEKWRHLLFPFFVMTSVFLFFSYSVFMFPWFWGYIVIYCLYLNKGRKNK